MGYTPISPFKRPMGRAQLQGLEDHGDMPAGQRIDKWAVLRDLSKAQAAFGITERDLTVLQGLVSFFPGACLGGPQTVVFPSNRSLCERLNGMPCSTMRRHLARLVAAGLLMRRDSPNGKRYMRGRGADRVAFGFDLSPLLRRAAEIALAAQAARATEARIRRLREEASLMRRDLLALADVGEDLFPGLGLWDQMRDMAILSARALRRRLTEADLGRQQSEMGSLLTLARARLTSSETLEMSTSDATDEHHQHMPDLDTSKEVIATSEYSKPAIDHPHRSVPEIEARGHTLEDLADNISHIDFQARYPSLREYFPRPVCSLGDLHDAARCLSSAMGISSHVWEEAQRTMGRHRACLVVLGMLEGIETIDNPGAYLQSLVNQAATGHFTFGRLLRGRDRRLAA